MTIRAGVLSDTHLHRPDSRFKRLIRHCFADCDLIIHAGDLTDLCVLEALADRPVHAVHGNCCHHLTRDRLPLETSFSLAGFTIALTHGAHLGSDIESRLWDRFPEADCVIYGHTHRPVCHRVASMLIINPGAFQETGRYGAAGTYAILEAGQELIARIHEVPRLR